MHVNVTALDCRWTYRPTCTCTIALSCPIRNRTLKWMSLLCSLLFSNGKNFETSLKCWPILIKAEPDFVVAVRTSLHCLIKARGNMDTEADDIQTSELSRTATRRRARHRCRRRLCAPQKTPFLRGLGGSDTCGIVGGHPGELPSQQ